MFARGLADTFLHVYGVRAATVFMIVTSTIGLRTGVLVAAVSIEILLRARSGRSAQPAPAV